MTFVEKNAIRYFTFDIFKSAPVIHGIFTRHGGVSPEPWASLNLGGTVGDVRGRVIENRRRMFEAVDLPVESLYDAWQVHGDRIVVVNSPRPLEQRHEKADAIITSSNEVTLLMRFADCVPVFLYDPTKNVIGIVHAGWMGTVKKIVLKTVQEMNRIFGSMPGNILAGIGPSIGPEQYEVGADVIKETRRAFPEEVDRLLISKQNGTAYLNLWEANRIVLMKAGVQKIEVAQISTAANTHDWYSHREEKGKTGRFGALIALR